jgi:hypothetical protein
LKRLIVGLLSVVALVVAGSAAADPPTLIHYGDVFDDVNPCTGAVMTVTLAGAAYEHDHNGRIHGHAERTITTSDGFAGRGVDMFLSNGQVIVFRFTDIMTNASGDRFRATGVFVLDESSGTVRVDKFSLTCLGS